MLGYSVKLSTLRRRPADADPARGATLGDDVWRMIPDMERVDVSMLNGDAVSESSASESSRLVDSWTQTIR